MFTAFSTALSALTADSTAVNVVGNNLANMNTTGFKASEVSFQDLVSQALSGNQSQAGFGVAPVKITQVYTQGATTPTSGQYDAAISGSGFFVVKNAEDQQLYTRNGSFKLDANGSLLTNTGQNVQGWNFVDGVLNTAAPVGNISIPTGTLRQPVPTANMSVSVNLDASQAVGSTGANFSTTIPVIDSLGQSHDVQISFQKTAANSWTYDASIPGEDLAAGTAGTPSSLMNGTLTFDSQGRLLTPAAPPPASNDSLPIAVTGLSNGAADMTINWQIWDTSSGTPVSNLTQVVGTSSADSPTQDGSKASEITSVSVGTGGEITAYYAGGNPRVVGQLALASIRNPDTLIGVGDGNLQLSTTTALPSIGVPSSGGRGDVIGGALEASTVDIATEFTKLIVYQRSYEASGKVITTANSLSQATINLVQ